jgi:glycine/D-amino acid oxidase-like deaminating enzyme
MAGRRRPKSGRTGPIVAKQHSIDVGVLGAGIQGSCIALELARRGHRVDLYDRCNLPLTQASWWNEGKIHLGLVYANDPTGRTHETMLRGALHFVPYLSRWIGSPVALTHVPFDYAVHRSSLLSGERIEAHFARVESCYREMSDGLGLRYPGSDGRPFFVAMSAAECNAQFDADLVTKAYRTAERAANPRQLAVQLRAAIAAEKRIRFVGDTEVLGIMQDDRGAINVSLRQDGQLLSVRHAQIANALWAGRLAVDRTANVAYRRPWMYRTKLGFVLAHRSSAPAIPSVTFLLGSYGDSVRYDDGTLYVSWYPDCMIGSSSELVTRDFVAGLDAATRRAIVLRSMAAMSMLIPALGSYGSCSDNEIGGGVIAAWGDAGIDHPDSELHRRYDIGVSSYGKYHSVDTGKYTMAPLFAVETCDRIEGII